jgi:DNA-directed RNA polymerase specialized sigma24 family protein
MKMEGYTNEEIARRIGCSLSTVERKLRRIRHEWASVELKKE